MTLSLAAFTARGCQLAAKIAAAFPGSSVWAPESLGTEALPLRDLHAWTEERFAEGGALVFVGAAGIAVRAIAPFIKDKFTDPAVLSVDEAGRFVIPLLSGHVGGANALARKIAEVTGGEAAISTATDVNGLFAVDVWAAKQGLVLCGREAAKHISAALLRGEKVGFCSDFPVEGPLPESIEMCAAERGKQSVNTAPEPDNEEISAAGKADPGAREDLPGDLRLPYEARQDAMGEGEERKPTEHSAPEPDETKTFSAPNTAGSGAAKDGLSARRPGEERSCPALGFCVTLDEKASPFAETLRLIPKVVTVGVGCHRGISEEEVRAAVFDVLERGHISPKAVLRLATIDVKRDEAGLLAFAEQMGWPIRFFTAEELSAVPGEFSASAFVKKTVGVENVCERAAVLSGGELLIKKQAGGGMTVAASASPYAVYFKEETAWQEN